MTRPGRHTAPGAAPALPLPGGTGGAPPWAAPGPRVKRLRASQLEHYTCSILDSWSAKYSAARKSSPAPAPVGAPRPAPRAAPATARARSARALRLLAAVLPEIEARPLPGADAAPGAAPLAWSASQLILLDLPGPLTLALLRLHARYIAAPLALLPPLRPPALLGEGAAPPGARRLRLGYLSYSFGLGVRNGAQHSAMPPEAEAEAEAEAAPKVSPRLPPGLMYRVFEAHDRARVEVLGFAIRPHDEGASAEERARVEANLEHFVDVSQDSLDGVAQRQQPRSCPRTPE